LMKINGRERGFREMAKLIFMVELDYDGEIMHGYRQEGIDWFNDEILRAKPGKHGLVLHSNEIGEEIGTITVISEVVTI